MSTQTKHRKGDHASVMASIPAMAEFLFNTTNNWIHAGNNVISGGFIFGNAFDEQNNTFTSGEAGGSENAITLSIFPAPDDTLPFQRWLVKATDNNTGPCTFQINDKSAKSIRKRTAAGLAELEAGDIIQDFFYTLIDVGTYYLVESLHAVAGLTTVSQGNINTAIGTFSANPNEGVVSNGSNYITYGRTPIVLPGGQYGLGLENAATIAGYDGGWWYGGDSTSYVHSAYPYMLHNSTPQPVFGRERYITSSAPWTDLEGKEAAGFFYMLLNAAGEIQGHYLADAPPWGYNGPTSVKADRVCPVTKKKFKFIREHRSMQEVLDGSKPKYREVEITDEVKRADADLIPHPFRKVPNGHTVVLIDTQDERIQRMVKYQNDGNSEEILSELRGGKFQVDNTPLNRKSPLGVSMHRMTYKYSKKGA